MLLVYVIEVLGDDQKVRLLLQKIPNGDKIRLSRTHELINPLLRYDILGQRFLAGWAKLVLRKPLYQAIVVKHVTRIKCIHIQTKVA